MFYALKKAKQQQKGNKHYTQHMAGVYKKIAEKTRTATRRWRHKKEAKETEL